MSDNTAAQTEDPVQGKAEVGAEPESEAREAQSGPGEAGGVLSDEEKNAALEAKAADLAAQVADLNDQYLRKAADFENFRKRMNREKQEAIDFANQSLLLDLIPIIDDFERAIKASETSLDMQLRDAPSKDFKTLYEGISMIEKRLVSQLENKWGLKRFDSTGEAFDPNRHEAIMMEKSAEITEPVVREDFIKGYTLKDRVVRSAKVKVLMPENPGENHTDEAVTTGNK